MRDILRLARRGGTLADVDDEEQVIYRAEVRTIMWKLADIDVNVRKILRYLEGDDDEWEETEEEEDPPGDA